MRFNNAGDPIYVVFEKIEDRPLSRLVTDFLKELRDDSIRFVSSLVK